MHPFEVLADPVRRRILEILGAGEVSAGGIGELVGAEFGISQPAISQHLKVLRDSGLAVVRPEGAKRFYRVDQESLAAAATWFEQFADPFRQPLDALATELARGRRSAGVEQRRQDDRADAGAFEPPGHERVRIVRRRRGDDRGAELQTEIASREIDRHGRSPSPSYR